MGITIDLKENRTIFIPCDCKNQVLSIEYDHQAGLANLAIYENWQSYNHKLSLWQKIKTCCNIFAKNRIRPDQMVLNNKQLRDLGLFIRSLNIS